MRKVSLRGLLAHKYRLVLTVLAVVVSVAFMSGTQVLTSTVSASFDKIFDDVFQHIDVVVRARDKVDTPAGPLRGPIAAEVVDVVREVDGAAAVEGHVEYERASILDRGGDPLVPAQAGPPQFGFAWPESPELNGWVLADGGRAPTAPDEAVIDGRSAERGGYAVGDRVKVETRRGVREFTIVGLAGFGTTPDYAGSSGVLLEPATAREVFGNPGELTRIDVAAAEGTDPIELRRRITAALPPGTEAITGEAFTDESQDVFRQFLDILGNILLAFGLVALFVGTFIIYNTFSIIVAQRTRELALLRAMGASRRQVLGSVTFEAFLVGAVSSALGLLAGIGLARALTALITAQDAGVRIDSLSYPVRGFAVSFVVGVLITVASALIPARRASSIPPVAAMRSVAVDTSNRSTKRLVSGILCAVLGALSLYVGLFTQSDNSLAITGAGIFFVILGAITLGPLFARPMSRVIGAPLRRFNGRLARANAMRNPRRTAATASALMIGVALIVMFAIVIQSLKSSVSAGLASAFTADVVVDSRSFGTTGLERSLAPELDAVPGVAGAVGIEIGFGTIAGQPAQVLGADLGRLSDVVALTTITGNLSTLADNEVAISKALADDQGLRLGSDIPLAVISGGERVFKVGAVYELKDVGSLGYLVSEQGFAGAFPPQFQTYNQIFLTTEPGADIDEVVGRLKPIVKERFPSAAVQNLAEYADAQSSQFDVMLVIVTVLLALAIVVAALGIVNTLLLSVYERTREIGLLRAVGMSRRQIRSVVGWESVIFSLQGTLIGMVIGTLFALALVKAFAAQTPLISLSLPWGLLVAVPLLALLAGMAAAILPARSAARLRVLDAISSE